MKRAQGLPISTIIIAALGIIVLIVLGTIFSGQIEKFGRAASACSGRCYKDASKVSALLPNTQVLYDSNKCNTEFEAPYRGATVPSGLPKLPSGANPSDYRCDECCVPTG